MGHYFTNLANDLGDHWILYATMPLIAALIGFLTKLAAVEMLFSPLEFRGVRPIFGWQGLIPRYAPRMAAMSMDLMLTKLIGPEEVMARIDWDEVNEKLKEPLVTIAARITDQLMSKYQPTLWEAMPTAAKRLVIKRVETQAPQALDALFAEFQRDLDQVIDLRTMAVDALVRDKALLVRLTRDIARKELRFLVRAGLVFGFVLGIGQVFLWSATKQPWIMPLFGFFVGYFTDWLGLNLIFRPIRSRGFLVFRWQGLFHRRRAEVARDYGNLIADEILNTRNLMHALLHGPSSDRLFSVITHEVQATIDRQSGLAKPITVFAMGGRRYQEMKLEAAQLALEMLPGSVEEIGEYALESANLRALVAEKMMQMTPIEYEGVLRPAFKQDEWKLVLIGGVLGGLIGELQVLFLLDR